MTTMTDRIKGMSSRTLILLLTIVPVLLAAFLINRVASSAVAINNKARNINKVAVSIDDAALAVTNLDTTNSLAGSILVTASPLDVKLAEIERLAKSVDAHAASINATAGDVTGTAAAINGSAATITTSASGINDQAAKILDVAQSINRGVAQINANLDATISVVRGIAGDADNILAQANAAHVNAACIDQALGKRDGHCT